jgi:hypothetical protein
MRSQEQKKSAALRLFPAANRFAVWRRSQRLKKTTPKVNLIFLINQLEKCQNGAVGRFSVDKFLQQRWRKPLKKKSEKKLTAMGAKSS